MVRNHETLVRETLQLKWTRIDGLSKGSRTYSEYRFYQLMPTGYPPLLIHTMRAGGHASQAKAELWFNNKSLDIITAAINAREAQV